MSIIFQCRVMAIIANIMEYALTHTFNNTLSIQARALPLSSLFSYSPSCFLPFSLPLVVYRTPWAEITRTLTMSPRFLLAIISLLAVSTAQDGNSMHVFSTAHKMLLYARTRS